MQTHLASFRLPLMKGLPRQVGDRPFQLQSLRSWALAADSPLGHADTGFDRVCH